MSKPKLLRLFLDSNVLTGGILAAWGLDKAVLSLCAARICRMVLAEYVRDEGERRALMRFTPGLCSGKNSTPEINPCLS